MFSTAQERDADELNILQHVHVHDAWANLPELHLLSATPSELQGEVHPGSPAPSRLCHGVRARIRAARCGNPGEFNCASKASLLIHRWPLQFSEGSATREEDVLKEHVLLRNIALPEKAIAFMRVLAGHLIANCASLLHTKIKDNKTISGYFGGATHGYNGGSLPSKFCSRGLAFFWTRYLRRLQDATRRHREDPTVLPTGGAIPITQR
jgi:hypothetical protein